MSGSGDDAKGVTSGAGRYLGIYAQRRIHSEGKIGWQALILLTRIYICIIVVGDWRLSSIQSGLVWWAIIPCLVEKRGRGLRFGWDKEGIKIG